MVNTNYSEKQLKIITGEIPLEKVHTNELISIHKKAYNVGDHVLAETVLNKIFIERQLCLPLSSYPCKKYPKKLAIWVMLETKSQYNKADVGEPRNYRKEFEHG